MNGKEYTWGIATTPGKQEIWVVLSPESGGEEKNTGNSAKTLRNILSVVHFYSHAVKTLNKKRQRLLSCFTLHIYPRFVLMACEGIVDYLCLLA